MAEAAANGKLTLKGRYEIVTDDPLPAFDSPRAKAYSVIDTQGDRPIPLMGLLLDRRLPVRQSALDEMRECRLPGLLTLLDSGQTGRRGDAYRQMCLIYERPSGPRLTASEETSFKPFPEEAMERQILPRMLPVLKELQARNVTHRAIRPSNLFHSGDNRGLVLGECFSAPPAADQPDFLEPIESAMADPLGRGDGEHTDDYYALGVTILCLLLGKKPEVDGNNNDLLHLKMELGSFSALAGRYTMSLPIVEMLRGLLNDDPRERWGITDLEHWLAGRHRKTQRGKLPLKAARAITIAKAECVTSQSAAFRMSLDWENGAQMVRSQSFDNWLRRSLHAEDLAKSLQGIVGGTGPEPADAKALSRACMVLFPSSPISFKGISVNPDGIAYMVPASSGSQAQRQKLGELLAAKVPSTWFATNTAQRSDFARLQSLLDRMATLMAQTGPGFGYERIIYELSPSIHCLSPLIESRLVVNYEELLPAMEAAVSERLPSHEPLDRHTAAFIAARCRQVTDRWIRPLAAEADGFARIVAQVRLMAFVQGLSSNGPLPNLCRWLEIHLRPVLSQFHNLKRRKQMLSELEVAAKSGIIGKMMVLVEDNQARAKDEQGYRAAIASFGRADMQVKQLQNEANYMEYTARLLGEQVSAVASGVIGGLASVAILAFYMI